MAILGSIFGILMRWCYQLVHNYGMAIILFTIITKIVLFPLSYWLQLNSIKMVKMYPALNNIKVKYFGNKDAIADEQAKLYKENKYNPLGSLIPLIIQIVLLMGVVEVIYHPMDYVLHIKKDTQNAIYEVARNSNPSIDFESNSVQLSIIEDIHENKGHYEAVSDVEFHNAIEELDRLDMNFLGFDLSWISVVEKGKALLVPLLAAFSSWLLAYAQNKMNVLQTEQSTLNQYGMMAFSVGLSLYLGAFVPAGVALYWIVSNLLAILTQYICNLLANPKKYIDYKALNESKEALKALEDEQKKERNSKDHKRVKEDYKRFFSIGNKHLVFYSEGSGFYKYFKGFTEYILKYTNIPIHYITSDPSDQIFEIAKTEEKIKPYYIDSTTLITLMMKMDADVVVMTMPDLENYQIKRSYVKKDIEYINVQHGIGSVNLLYRKGALDHFDTVFVSAKNQKDEIEAQEKVYSLPKKKLIECGYPLLDEMQESYRKMEVKNAQKTILIAPSWQKDNIVDSCLEELLDNLGGHEYKIIVRPHPQHVRHMKGKMDALKEKYKNNPEIEIQTDFSSNSTVFEADALITDWSDIGTEYAFTTYKPVLYINTPMKIMNPEYEKIPVEPLNIRMRNIVGKSLELNELDKAYETVKELVENGERYHNQIKDLVEEEMYHLGDSAVVGARYIIMSVFEHINQKENS